MILVIADNCSRMRLEHEPELGLESGVVVRLSGALEVNAAAVLWQFAAAQAAAGTRFFRFDLTRVNILTSAGIGILVRLFVRLQKVGGSVAIHGCSDKVREVFTIVMLESTLGVCATEAEARRRLRDAAAG